MTTSVELRHFRHFIALAEELHFGRAAQRCNISQPPFSVSIRQLEESLGFALVERNTHGVRLTPAGTAYHQELVKVISQMERAQRRAQQVNAGLSGSIEVGFFASMLYRGLDEAVRVFAREHPEVNVRLVELSTVDQIPALLGHRIHYGFVHTDALPESVESHELLRERFVLCVPHNHAQARRGRVALVELAKEKFILFSRAFSPRYYDQVVSICVSAGFHPEIRHEARHWLTVLACVSKGLGVTLVPSSLARTATPGLAFVEIEESPVLSFVRGAWRRAESADAALQAWHEVVLANVKA
ncbi:MAG: LysR family transcriptional regulator [Alcaligenaceae bacterium]|nr:MAG: LysR family transcriptional regulator [Alcaligenaceae bacterium]